MTDTNKVWDKTAIATLLASNERAVQRALLVIYDRQTATEQSSEQTIERNNRGFTGVDAKILSSFADQFRRKGWLSPKQVALCRRKLPKYWRQLKEEIEARAAVTPVAAPAVPMPAAVAPRVEMPMTAAGSW